MTDEFNSKNLSELVELITSVIRQNSPQKISPGYETVDVLPMPKKTIEESTQARAAYILDYVINDGIELTTMATASRPITLEDNVYHIANYIASKGSGQSFIDYLTKVHYQRKIERDYGISAEERTFLALDQEKNLIGGITVYNPDVQGMDQNLKLAALGDLWVEPLEGSKEIAGKLITLAMDFVESQEYNLCFGATSDPELYQKYIPGIEVIVDVFDPLPQNPHAIKTVMAKVITPYKGHETIANYERIYKGKGGECIW